MNNEFYSLEALSLSGRQIKMSEFKGKVILIVNTASKCGFTPQYEGLEALYQKYKERGFVILGFPCNQFGNQEPGSNDEIASGCLVNYGVTFPMFSKVDVNGPNTHQVFDFVKSLLPGITGESIKWNFTKFLLDGEAHPVRRFAPFTKPEKIAVYIEKLLK